eukprot:7506674-Heterocapsa_arctica.AAC.1
MEPELETRRTIRASGQKPRKQPKKKNTSCRIGEATNPGPGQQAKQAKQRKLGYFFVRSQRHIDYKSEWCKAKGFNIHNIK